MASIISEEKFREIIKELGLEYRGITKSGEVLLEYEGKTFSMGRKKKEGNKEGYKAENIRRLINKIAIEKARKEGKSPGMIYHELRKRLRDIYYF